jgi:hypothetical protein
MRAGARGAARPVVLLLRRRVLLCNAQALEAGEVLASSGLVSIVARFVLSGTQFGGVEI